MKYYPSKTCEYSILDAVCVFVYYRLWFSLFKLRFYKCQLKNRLKIICLCLCRSGLNHSAHRHLRIESEIITCKYILLLEGLRVSCNLASSEQLLTESSPNVSNITIKTITLERSQYDPPTLWEHLPVRCFSFWTFLKIYVFKIIINYTSLNSFSSPGWILLFPVELTIYYIPFCFLESSYFSEHFKSWFFSVYILTFETFPRNCWF